MIYLIYRLERLVRSASAQVVPQLGGKTHQSCSQQRPSTTGRSAGATRSFFKFSLMFALSPPYCAYYAKAHISHNTLRGTLKIGRQAPHIPTSTRTKFQGAPRGIF